MKNTYYDIDEKAADQALQKYQSNIDKYIASLEKPKKILEELSEQRKDLKTEENKKMLTLAKGKILLLQKQIDGLTEIKALSSKFLVALKEICNKNGEQTAETKYHTTLDNFINKLKEINAFRITTKMKHVKGSAVLWNKIEPRMAIKLLEGTDDIVLEDSLAGAPIEDPLWGVKKWSTDPKSPVTLFWSKISEEFVNSVPIGKDIKAYVFEKIFPESVLEKTELPNILKKIERKEIGNVLLYKTKFYNQAMTPVYTIEGELPKDLHENKAYIFKFENQNISLYYYENKEFKSLKIDDSIIKYIEKRYKKSFKELISPSKELKILENESPCFKIRELIDSKKSNAKIFYMDSLPTTLEKRYDNSFIILKPSTTQKSHTVFFVNNQKLHPETIKDTASFESNLKEIEPKNAATIADKTPSLYRYVRAIISKNSGHDRYNHLEIPEKYVEIKNYTETKTHTDPFSSIEIQAQSKWYNSQKNRGKFDKIFKQEQFRNHSVFRAVLSFNPDDMISFIKEHKIDINKCNKNGWSLLLLATLAGNTQMVKKLLDNGAKDDKGTTALKAAQRLKHDDIVKILTGTSQQSTQKKLHLGITKKRDQDIEHQQLSALSSLSTVVTKTTPSQGNATTTESPQIITGKTVIIKS